MCLSKEIDGRFPNAPTTGRAGFETEQAARHISIL